MLDIAMLGVGGGMPMPSKYLSAHMLNFKGRKILIDCGEGTQVSLRELGWGFKAIDLICITHGHGDHIIGLPGLLATMGNSGRENPITIIGPKGIVNIVNGLRVAAPYLPFEINIVEAINSKFKFICKNENLILSDNENSTYEALEISTLELDHSAPCIGYSFNIRRAPKFDIQKATENLVPKSLWGQLQKGKPIEFENKIYTPDLIFGENRKGLKLSFTTDTRPTNKIIDFIKESDLFVCEGTYGDDEDIEKAIKNKHMTFREAATLASEGRVKELLLTHFSPAIPNPMLYIKNAKDIFKETTIGETHLIKTLNFE